MHGNWTVLIPPLLVLLIAIKTHHVTGSLLVGIICASFIAGDFSLLSTIKIASTKLFMQTGLYNLITWQGSFDQLYIFCFLLLLGVFITLISYTGGTVAYSKIIKKKLSGKKAAETASLFLSCCFFIDDAFNTLTTGSIIRPIFNQFSIAQVKLAFLLDIMSSSLCVLIPLSSWTPVIVGQLLQSGVTEHATQETLIMADPYFLYLQAVPFCFYSLISIATAFFIVRRNISYGSMKTYEKIAQETTVHSKKNNKLTSKTKQGTLIDFLLPMGLLIFFIFIGLLYTGNYTLFGGHNNFISALQSSNNFLTFFFANLLTLFISIIYFLHKKSITIHATKKIFIEGYFLMIRSVLLIWFASTLGNLLKEDLGTGQYLAHILLGSMPTYILPLIFFITSSTIAFSAGSSWGTILIMFPIAIPMISSLASMPIPLDPAYVPIIFSVLGAILSGAVAGAHMSPISDTTIMASTSSGAPHIDHITTQLNYVLPCIAGTSVSFLIAGFFQSYPLIITYTLSFFSGLFVTLSIVTILNYYNNS